MDDATGDIAMDFSLAPVPISRLVGWLQGQGFDLVEGEGPTPESFGNQYGIWNRNECRFEIVCDRDDWSVGIQVPASDYWAHPGEWEAYLGGFPLAGDLASLDHQVEFIQAHLTDILKSAAVEDAVDEVQRIGRDWVERRLGLFAGPDPDV